MKRARTALLLLAILVSGSQGAWAEDGPIPLSNPEPSRVEPDFGTPAVVEGVVTLRVQCRGAFVALRARATSVTDEYLVRADDRDLQRLAEAFEARLEWLQGSKTLLCTRGISIRSIKLGQNRVQIPPSGGGVPNAGTEEAELAVPAQEIDGVTYVPFSALEEFFDARITVRGQQMYIEPLIRSVTVEPSSKGSDSLALKVDASAPVSYKAFFLKNPDRYVIDVQGGVLDTPDLTVLDPSIGTIRLGQFELGPATSRIVVPLSAGVKVHAPVRGQGRDLAFAVSAPQRSSVPAVEAIHISKVALDSDSRLQISADQPLRYTAHRFPDNRYVLDVKGAVLSNPKNEFPVDSDNAATIRVCQYAPLPSPVVRVVVELKGESGVVLKPSDGERSLTLEVVDKLTTAVAPLPPSPPDPLPPDQKDSSVTSGAGVIVIDPGHGGSDVGAQNRAIGINEATVTLDIAKRLATSLRSRGWTVIMTRTTDVDVTYCGSSSKAELQARSDVANRNHADVFVSIHCNASANPGGNGTSLHYYKQGDYRLARELQPGVLSATARANRGLQANRFYVLVHTNMPAVLVETAFLTNPQEGSLLADPTYRQRIADGLAQGLGSYAARNHSWPSAKR